MYTHILYVLNKKDNFMDFNNTTDRNGIIQNIERLTDRGIGYISGNANLLLDTTADVNKALSTTWHDIITASGIWSFDDTNQTDLPVSTTSLVAGQSEYLIPDESLAIERVEIMDKNGTWTRLTQRPLYTIGTGVEEKTEPNGIPYQYRLYGNVIQLFPASEYNSAGGLKIFYNREFLAFESDDTTTSAGFASAYHEILPIMASIDWYMVKQPSNPTLKMLIEKYNMIRANLIAFYKGRNHDYTPRIQRACTNTYR
jgi:hypothetical protein